MKLYTTLPKSLMPFFQEELSLSQDKVSAEDYTEAWKHLERAHIIGQRYPFAHTYVHWKMLQFGFRIKSGKEIIGQVPRLIFGGVKSFIGTVPVGNPGGANVPPLKPFPIQEDLLGIFNKAGIDIH